jgi:hypothetical protein
MFAVPEYLSCLCDLYDSRSGQADLFVASSPPTRVTHEMADNLAVPFPGKFATKVRDTTVF